MGHTPGPWEIVPLKHRGGRSNTYRIQQAAQRYPRLEYMHDVHLLIAETFGHRFGAADNVPRDTLQDLANSGREGCQAANARLIAEAPAMLAALKRLSDAIKPIRDGERNGAAFGQLSISDDEIRSILDRIERGTA